MFILHTPAGTAPPRLSSRTLAPSPLQLAGEGQGVGEREREREREGEGERS